MSRSFLLLSIALSAAVAACDEESEPGSPCRDDLTCGSGLVCNFQSETPTCLAPEADLDADGIKNSDDKCPAMMASSNNDEDGDGQGDACDTCPIERWRKTTKDNDKDGLSGSCDPDDFAPGDKIVYFDTFTSSGLADWTLDDAAHFSVADGALKVGVTATDPSAEAKRVLATGATSLAVLTSYRVTDPMPAGIDSTSREVTVGFYDPSPAAGGQPARCGAVSTSGGAGRLALSTGAGSSSEGLLSSFLLNEPYRLTLQLTGNSARCVQIRADSVTTTATSGSGDLLVGLVMTTRSVLTTFDYVLVISSPSGR